MYEEFYGLTEKPFSIQPDPSFIYWGRAHRLAYAMLEYGVLNQAGISIVTGEVGCGKTTLIHRLLEQLSDTHAVALLSNIQRDRGDLLSWVLMGFGQPFSDMNHVEKFQALQRFFIDAYGNGRRVVLIIDEAQNLSIDMLEEIRMLSNINAGKHQLLQLILVGQPQLKQLLNRPDMLQLVQRVGADFHLTPLNREEVHAYIETRLAIAGASRRIFSEKAIDAIAQESRGVPRVINIIADTGLVYGFSAGEAVVSEGSIEAVVKDKSAYGVFGIASDADLELSDEPNAAPVSFLAGEGAAAAAVGRPNLRLASGGDAAPSGGRKDVKGAGEPTTLFPDIEPPARPSAKVTALAGASAKGSGGGAAGSAKPSARRSSDGSGAQSRARGRDGGADGSAGDKAPRAVSGVLGRTATASEPGVIGVIVHGEGAEAAAAAFAEDRPDEDDNIRVILVRTAAADGEAANAPAGADEIAEVAVDSATSGRACNAGYRKLKKIAPDVRYVQFVGPDARLADGWLPAAAAFLARRPEVAAVCGAEVLAPDNRRLFPMMKAISLRQREGELVAANEDLFVRAEAFEAAGGFRGDIPHAEVADLCIRLRRRGAHIWRLDERMTVIDPPVRSIGQWLAAARRDGVAYAMRCALHGMAPERLAMAERVRALFWGLWAPALILIIAAAAAGGAFVLAERSPIGPIVAATIVLALGAAVYVLKAAAIALPLGPFNLRHWLYGGLVTIGRFAEAAGILSAGKRVREIEKSRRR